MTPGLWDRVRALLSSSPPMTTRAIALALNVERTEASSLLNVYAKYGQLVRVVKRDCPLLHWRLAVRDPRRDPIAGDALKVGGELRRVTRIQRRVTGALHKVYGPNDQFWHAHVWRMWAISAEVITRGNEVDHEA